MTMSLQAPDFGGPSSFDEDARFLFDSLQEYLQNDCSNADTTAVKITAFISMPSEAEATEAVESSLGLLWTTFLHVVKQVPHKHLWQGRLISLLVAIKRLPPNNLDSADTDIERVWGSQNWAQLPLFGAEMREAWNRGPWTKWPEGFPAPLPE